MACQTPEEFIQYYSNKLMEKFNNRGIQINKVGVIGFFMNLLGWTRFDVENYYDSLFKETHIYTAQTYENIIFRGASYGYKPKFATPSTATGTIEFNFDNIPLNPNTVTYEITFSCLSLIKYYRDNVETSLVTPAIVCQTEEESIKFSSLSTYKFIKKNVSGNEIYTAIIQDENLNVQQIPSNDSTIIAPFVNFYQYETVEISFKIPIYKIGSFYTYEIKLDVDEYIYDIEVYIKDPHDSIYDKYSVQYTKYFSTPTDKHVFFRWTTFNRYAIDFGSGQYGRNVSGSDCYIVYKKTKGSRGNLSVESNTSKMYVPLCSLIQYDSNENVISITPFDLKKAAKITIVSAEGGEDILDIDTFRDEVIKFIQTRDNLVSRGDFYNVVGKYLNDFEILFKKTAVFENTFYLYRVLRDKYQIPVYTKTYTEVRSNFTTQYHPVFTINSIDFVSPFYYRYNSIMNWYDAVLLVDEQIIYFSQTDVENYDGVIPIMYLKLVYDSNNDQTIYYLKSYQDISSRTFKISISTLNIDNDLMTEVDTNTYSYTVNGISTDQLSVIVSEYESGTPNLYYKVMTGKFYQAYDISDLLRLQIYNDGTSDYVINIPLIEKDKFEADKQYYYDLLIGYLVNLNLTENRMITDNLQTRFFETQVVLQAYHNTLLKQSYDFDINLPLKLSITLKIDKKQITINKINLNDETNFILQDVSNFLLQNCSSNILLYGSRIVDIILNNERTQYIKDVDVLITDSSGNVLNQGLESKSLDQFLYDFSGTKLDIVKFTPVYWWFDINNLQIDTQME
jgi:hypothetical protein